MKSLMQIEREVAKIITVTITQGMNTILQEAKSLIQTNLVNVDASYGIEIDEENMTATIYNKNDMIAYLEFGTGKFAEAYLADKPKEMTDEAWKFFKTGKGTLKEQPHLFKTYYKYKPIIEKQVEDRIQAYLDKL